MWEMKETVVPVVIGALEAVTPKLGEWLQQRVMLSPGRE